MDWLEASNEKYTFEAFSISHITVILLLFTISGFIFLYRTKLGQSGLRKTEWVTALSLLAAEIGFHLWMIQNGIWTASQSLPLELCSISLFLTVALLITRCYVFYELLLFTSLLGASQALFTPVLIFDFPHFRFFHFFYTHLIIIWVPLYFTWVFGYRPTLSSVIKVFLFLNTLLPIVMGVNRLVMGNYMFLSHKPESTSLLDSLGPYPWYILSLEGLLAALSLIVWILFRERTADGPFRVNK
ncbi:putative integral membrane protein (TIGR02206 family) [Peribacillus deserti]|uniref:Integral membrane protein (TIGR02206 family) n=1 Tax=Peribacillus deserti TaxID=673318 RepID=A0ABS2QD30_9BACI|nr:TIGR02206 family membrane protein [Peribacillus deserti]MBM7691066.1 putative integral membrane protein (TIGR02206 family) [Peribacillus deserti]